MQEQYEKFYGSFEMYKDKNSEKLTNYKNKYKELKYIKTVKKTVSGYIISLNDEESKDDLFSIRNIVIKDKNNFKNKENLQIRLLTDNSFIHYYYPHMYEPVEDEIKLPFEYVISRSTLRIYYKDMNITDSSEYDIEYDVYEIIDDDYYEILNNIYYATHFNEVLENKTFKTLINLNHPCNSIYIRIDGTNKNTFDTNILLDGVSHVYTSKSIVQYENCIIYVYKYSKPINMGRVHNCTLLVSDSDFDENNLKKINIGVITENILFYKNGELGLHFSK